MLSSSSNKALLITVLALGLLYVISLVWSPRSKERTFRDVVMTLDTASVVAFEVQVPNTTGPFRISRDENNWRIEQGELRYMADAKVAREFLGAFAHVKTKRYAGAGTPIRERYALTDPTAKKIRFEMVDGMVREVWLGNSSFSTNTAGNPSAQVSYFNLPGEDEVYSVEGDVSMRAGQEFDMWRPRHLVKSNPSTWTKVTLNFAPDSSMSFLKAGQHWTIDGDTAEMGQVINYFSTISTASLSRFVNDAQIDDAQPAMSVVIEDTTRPMPISINIYPWKDAYVLRSTDNPGSIFEFTTSRDMIKLFKGKEQFVHADH